MSVLKNKYCKILEKETEKESELFYRNGKDDEYWTIDHNVMRYFEDIEEIPENIKQIYKKICDSTARKISNFQQICL